MEDSDTARRLESLVCEYHGPMLSRNRDRVLNHVEAVSDRLALISKVRKDKRYIEILEKHFIGEISTQDAVDTLVDRCEWVSHDFPQYIDGSILSHFTKRHLVEFHPCDACNLCCIGCTFSQDTNFRPDAVSYPFDQLSKIFSLVKPDAITISGGGEPTLYKSGKYRLGDLICTLGNGDLGYFPAIGLITNGTIWPQGNQEWHQYADWVRYSLDASSQQSYIKGKGKDYFDTVVGNVLRSLTETNIPQVGVGFVYHRGNIAEAGDIICYFAKLIMQHCPKELHRFNIQFRPWRPPHGESRITEPIISSKDVEKICSILFRNIDQDQFLERFVRENTNIAVNLLCRGAREVVHPFSECYFGLAKTVIRADGSLYPCFRTAASRNSHFYSGNIITDTPEKIALRELHVIASSARQICASNHEKCLLCVFNNLLEKGIVSKHRPIEEVIGDYFF